jgi:hypothetical protein
MTISEETLMAYADGEADAATRASVEAAMHEDPEIAGRVARHRAMRTALRGAFSAVLEEPVPDRLIAAARGRGVSAHRPMRPARWQSFAMAASLILGVAIGYVGWRGSGSLIETKAGGLVARSALAEALSRQLSPDRGAGSPVVTGLSFRTKAGGYCRTFTLSGTETASGLACREGAQWKIKALAQGAQEESGANFRAAASALPPAIRIAVEESIDGEPLDRAGEIAARQAGWNTAAH